TGPYAVIRNPLYLGSMLMMFGFCSIIGDSWNWLLIVPFILLIANTTLDEERRLGKTFGPSWAAYMKATPRFIPRRASTKVFRNWSLRQWLESHEYQAAGAVGLALVGLQLWQWL